MFNKILSILIIAIIAHPSLFAENPELPDAPSATQAKVKADLTKYASEQKKVNLTLKDAAKLTGHVQQAGEENFQFKDARTGELRQIAYSDVTEAKKSGMTKSTKILIAVGIAAGFTLGMTAIACSNGTIHCQ